MAGKLLSAPMESNERSEVRNTRISPDYLDKSDIFRCTGKTRRDFQLQYHHLYSLRLQALRSRVESSVKSKYGPNVRILKLADLDNLGDNKKVVVIGTLMKNQIHKPSILKEYAEENAKSLENPPEEKREVFTDDSDDLVLEDEVQRAKLHFGQDQDFHVGQFVNGVVVGVYGHLIPLDDQDGGGRFKVIDIIYPETAPQVEKPLAAEDRYVLFISGIELSGPNPNAGLGALELATSWIVGEAGEMTDQEQNSKVERVIIAGNSLSEETKDHNVLRTAKYLTMGKNAKSVEAMSELDEVMAQLASSVGIDLMAGENDPANQNWPQQPLHKCLFPNAGPYKTFKTVTNPYSFEICGQEIVGTSGQNVDDIFRNSDVKDPLEVLENIAKWSHLAPTCPDTLGCFPVKERDPFVMSTLPRVLFVGNQEKFDQKTLTMDGGKQVLLLSLPRFGITGSVIQLNMKNLECTKLDFQHLSSFDEAIDSPTPDK